MPSTSEKLFHSLQQVEDEPSFLRFLGALRADRADEAVKELANPSSPWGPGANGWENPTVESFLEAAGAWAADSAKAPHQELAANPWRRCADILWAGKGYE